MTVPLNGLAQKNDYLNTVIDSARVMYADGKYDELFTYADKLFASDLLYYKARGYTYRNLAFEGKGDHEAALHACYEGLDLYRALNDTLGVSKTYNSIGIIFYNIGDRRKSIEFSKKASSILISSYHPRFDKTIGLYRQNLAGSYTSMYDSQGIDAYADSALINYNEGLKMLSKLEATDRNKLYKSRIEANMSLLYASMGDELALKYADMAIIGYANSKYSLNQSINYFAKSLYYENIGNYDLCLKYSDSSLALFPSGERNTHLLDIYTTRIVALKHLKMPEELLKYYELKTTLDNELHNAEQVVQLVEMVNEDNRKQILAGVQKDIKNLEGQHKDELSTFQQVLIGVSIALFLFISLVVFLGWKRKKDRFKLRNVEEMNQNLSEELKALQKEIQESANQLKEEITNENKNAKPSHKYIVQDVHRDLVKNEYGELIPEWRTEVAESFLVNLTMEFPKLSQLEVRMCVYLLIGLNSKEISIIQNVAPASVDRRRTRLRKKLGVARDVRLNDFLQEIEERG